MRYCLALDLKNDPALIKEYREFHKKIWPEIASSIYKAGILQMEIWNIADRMFMVMETADDFSFDRKRILDSNDPKVLEWENLMWKYQKALPFSKPGEKWILMEKIFDLGNQ